MKTYKNIILLIPIFCLCLTACRVSRQVVKTSDSVTSGISETKISYRDTTMYTQKVSTSFKLPISDFKKCPEEPFKQSLNVFKEPKTYTQKNGNAKAIVRVEHDTITITAECDSIALKAKIRNEYQKQMYSKLDKYSNELKEELKTNWYMVIGLWILAFIAGFLSRTLIKYSI